MARLRRFAGVVLMLIGSLLATGGLISVALALLRPDGTGDLGQSNAILIGAIFFGCGLGLIGIGRLNVRGQ